MARTRILVGIFSFGLIFSATALAFNQCDASTYTDPDQLAQYLTSFADNRAPVKYHDLALRVRVVTKNLGDSLMPFSTEQQGTKLVVFPVAFARFMCQAALSQYLMIDGSPSTVFDKAAGAAVTCAGAGGSRNNCLIAFANALDAGYRTAYTALAPDSQRTAFSIYLSGLHQVLMHEYAHHFLDHAARIRAGKVSRVDAEFEADLFAVLNGVQSGEPTSAMFYFFAGMASLENRAGNWATADYESGACRARNIEDISAVFGIAPVILVDAATGGQWRQTSATFTQSIDKQFAGPAPSLEDGSCARIAKVALGDAFQELKRLSLRSRQDADLLFAPKNKQDMVRLSRLIHDLSDTAEQSQYVNGVAVSMVAMILRYRGLAGLPLSPLTPLTDRLIGSPAINGNFLSDDFGRLLQAQGLATLQEPRGLARPARLERSNALLLRAVAYNPAQTEAWENLAFIAFLRADCASAARYADRSVDTLDPKVSKEERDGSIFFATQMKKWSADPNACKTEGTRFHPYPDL